VANKYETIDDYIASKPTEVQPILEEVRQTLRKAVPDTDEAISYEIPTLKLDGKYVVYFAAWKNHLSIYPIPDADEDFEKELAPYRSAKGTLKFPFRQPIPYDLIERVGAHLLRRRLITGHFSSSEGFGQVVGQEPQQVPGG
jgi:uncharacterized protein YdhG (YjbR/CyaY superfamily)